METTARIQNHPLHPMLIPFPIGLWVFSLISDIIFKAGWGGQVWRDVAIYTMAGGIIGALLAALPGLVDLLSIRDPRSKTIGFLHMSLNLLAVVLFCVNLWLRLHSDTAANLPMLLSIVGVLLIVVSGWLGGELVYVRRVGVVSPPTR